MDPAGMASVSPALNDVRHTYGSLSVCVKTSYSQFPKYAPCPCTGLTSLCHSYTLGSSRACARRKRSRIAVARLRRTSSWIPIVLPLPQLRPAIPGLRDLVEVGTPRATMPVGDPSLGPVGVTVERPRAGASHRQAAGTRHSHPGAGLCYFDWSMTRPRPASRWRPTP